MNLISVGSNLIHATFPRELNELVSSTVHHQLTRGKTPSDLNSLVNVEIFLMPVLNLIAPDSVFGSRKWIFLYLVRVFVQEWELSKCPSHLLELDISTPFTKNNIAKPLEQRLEL